MKTEELDVTIAEIDQALLRLFNAKDKGYIFFDFETQIKKLLHLSRNAEDKYKNIVRDFSTVFSDLLSPVVYIHFVVKEKIDAQNTIVWEQHMYYSKKGIAKVEDFRTTFGEQEFKEMYKDFKKGDYLNKEGKADSTISKFKDYLDGVKYWEGELKPDDISIPETMFQLHCIELFENAGYKTPMNASLDFEKYVKFMTVNNPIENDSKGFHASQAVFLLNELGFFDLSALKDMPTEKLGILVAAIIGKSTKNTTEFVRNKFTSPSKKLVDPIIKLMSEVGIKKNK